MSSLDPAGQFLRFLERYRAMSDDQLTALAREMSDLTDLGKSALTQELSSRGLGTPPSQKATLQYLVDTRDLPERDRELVELCIVWGRRDALNIQRILDVAGIPFFMGPENATCVDDVVSSFPDGVEVKVMQIAVPWARDAVRRYEPKDEPAEIRNLDDPEIAIRCPKCRLEDVVFVGQADETHKTNISTFAWFCDSCGYK